MRSSTHASPDDIDITSIWGALKRSARPLVLASLAAGALTFGVLSLMAPRYTSQAELKVDAKESANPFTSPKRDAVAPDSVQLRADKEAVNTHVRALMSADLANRIAAELKLAERREFNSALGGVDTFDTLLRMIGMGGPRPGESEQDRVLNAYFKRLEVYSPKETRIIAIRFTSVDADLAAEVANLLADTYRQSLASQSVVETDEVQKALEPKIERMLAEVAQAEAAIERFKGDKNIFKGGPQRTGLNEQQLGELTAELTKAKAARSEAEARARSAREMLKSGSADALPDVQKSPLIQALVQQRVRLEREISELSATLLPGHPRMKQLSADLAGLKKQLDGEVGKLVESLEKEAKVAAFREASVTRSIDEIKSQVVTTSTDEVELRQLEAVAKSKRTQLESLQAQFEANRSRADKRVVPIEAQIVTSARPSTVPVFPKKGQYAALVAVATLLFGIAWVVTRALLVGARGAHNGRHPLRRASDHDLGQAMQPRTATAASVSASPGAAEPPPLPDMAQHVATGVSADGETVEIATIAKLARFLRDRAPEKGGVRTLITGDTSMIDASSEALALADELIRDGLQVIVVDWSTRGEGFGTQMGVEPAPGFIELIGGSASFEDVIRTVPGGKAHMIASGAALEAGEGDNMIDVDKLNLLLDALDEAYDHIVVVGEQEEARSLFEAIQGRFDAGITVAEGKRRVAVLQDPPGTFLGFDVTDIALVRFVRAETKAAQPQRVVRRQAGLPKAEMRPGE